MGGGVLFVLVLLGLVVLGVVALGFVVSYLLKASKNHPANLSSISRRSVRPVTEAVGRLEQLVAENKDKAEVAVIGPQAVDAARQLREECMKWAAAREKLEEMRGRGQGSERVEAVLSQIDGKLAEAVESIDAMSARIGERAVASYDIPDDDSLNELVSRLESLSRSMDEAQETMDVRVR